MTESFSSHPDAGLLPELRADGLVLWRLRSGRRQLWCEVEDFAGTLSLRVHDPTTGETITWEVHPTVASVVPAADDLCADYLSAGWVGIDIDLDEPG